MSIMEKNWHIYVGDSWIGTLTPVGADGDWIEADFAEGNGWGNFAPWFQKTADAYHAGNDDEWDNWYSQLTAMGLIIEADDGEAYTNPTLIIEGNSAWFRV